MRSPVLTVNRGNSPAGFTLLEVLIGLTIFAIAAGSVSTSLYLGMNVSRRQDSRSALIQESIAAVEFVCRRLRCAYINPAVERITFSGTKEEVDFFAVSEEGDIVRVIFYLKALDDEETFRLLQSRQSYSSSAGPDAAGVEAVNRSVKSWEFSYYDEETQEWLDLWDKPAQLPRQIRISAKFGSERGGPKLLFPLETVVSLPVSKTIEFGRNEDDIF